MKRDIVVFECPAGQPGHSLRATSLRSRARAGATETPVRRLIREASLPTRRPVTSCRPARCSYTMAGR